MRIADYLQIVLRRWRAGLATLLVVVVGGGLIAYNLVEGDATVSASARVQAIGDIRSLERYALDSQGVAVEAVSSAVSALSGEAAERRMRADLGIARRLADVDAEVKLEGIVGTSAAEVVVHGSGDLPVLEITQWYADELIALAEAFVDARVSDESNVDIALVEPVEEVDRARLSWGPLAAVIVVLAMLCAILVALLRGLLERRLRDDLDVVRTVGELPVIDSRRGGSAALRAVVDVAAHDRLRRVVVVRNLRGADGRGVAQGLADEYGDGQDRVVLHTVEASGVAPTRHAVAQTLERVPEVPVLVEFASSTPDLTLLPALERAAVVVVVAARGESPRADLARVARVASMVEEPPMFVVAFDR